MANPWETEGHPDELAPAPSIHPSTMARWFAQRCRHHAASMALVAEADENGPSPQGLSHKGRPPEQIAERRAHAVKVAQIETARAELWAMMAMEREKHGL